MKEDRRKLIESVLEKVIGEEQNNNHHLPMVRPPETYSLERAREKKGFLSSWFDPQKRIRDHAQLERIRIEEQTKTKILEKEASKAIEMTEIKKDVVIEDFKDKAAKWLEEQKRRNKAAQAVVHYKEFVQLVDEVIDYGFPPYLEEKLIDKLYKIYFSDDDGLASSLASDSVKPPNPHYQTNRKK